VSVCVFMFFLSPSTRMPCEIDCKAHGCISLLRNVCDRFDEVLFEFSMKHGSWRSCMDTKSNRERAPSMPHFVETNFNVWKIKHTYRQTLFLCPTRLMAEKISIQTLQAV
jgi:hypothetical protein